MGLARATPCPTAATCAPRRLRPAPATTWGWRRWHGLCTLYGQPLARAWAAPEWAPAPDPCHEATEARDHTRMEKCLSCHIVLDCLCPKPLCPGHYNESQGDLCAYGATHQRDAWLQHPDWLDGVVSTLGAFLEYAQE